MARRKLRLRFEFDLNLVIILACLVAIASFALIFDSLYQVRFEVVSRRSVASQPLVATKVKAATTGLTLEATVQNCSVVIFSWQPANFQPVTLKVFEQPTNRLVLTKDYQPGSRLSVWSRAAANSGYWAGLYIRNFTVSNQVFVTTPPCG